MTAWARLVAGVLAVAIVVAAVWAITRDDGAAREPGDTARAHGASELAVVAIRGTPHALVAVVGVDAERPPAALVIPSGVTVVAPGQGETTLSGVAELPGSSVRVAISNAIGAWAEHYGVGDVDALAAAIDAAGGLAVDLDEPVTFDGVGIGPGATELTGSQVAEYLASADTVDVADARWGDVLEALLGVDLLSESVFVDSDDAAAVVGVLDRAQDAAVELPPVVPVAGQAIRLDQTATEELVRELFGVREATPIVVQNGNGQPNLGETVAERLLPGGFRIVLSQNADTFRHRETEIAATESEFADEAERVRELLGVGRVVVSQVPSGLADIMIVVGRDFTA